MASGPRRKALVEFHCWAALGHGESIYVCGDTTVLGWLYPEEGVPLQTPVAVFQREVISYKYAVFVAGKFDRWERFDDGQEARQIVVDTDLLPTLPDGSPSTTMNVADDIVCDGLLEWSEEDEPEEEECSAAAVAEASLRSSGDAAPEEEPPKEAEVEAEAAEVAVGERPPSPGLLFDAPEKEAEPSVRELTFLAAGERRVATVAAEAPERTAATAQRLEEASAVPSRLRTPSRAEEFQKAAKEALGSFVEMGGRAPLEPTDGVVVVSVFLPVIVEKVPPSAASAFFSSFVGTSQSSSTWSIRWDFESLLSLQAPLRVTRIGIARVPPGTTAVEEIELAALLRRAPWNCIAIFLEAETYELFYHDYCKGVLWPVFHNSLEVFGAKPMPGIDDEDDEDDGGSKAADGGDKAMTAADGGGFFEVASTSSLVGAPGSMEARVKSPSNSELTTAATVLLSNSSSRQSIESGTMKPVLSDSSFAEMDEADEPLGGGAFRRGGAPPPPATMSASLSQASTATKRQRVSRIDRAWHAYKRVNQIFRDYVVEAYNEGDLIWVNGFQLALLPAFLSRRLTVAKLGLFLHTPFPSSEIFRTLSARSELLRGMLSADQIGFHLYEYARHFITTCKRVLGVRTSFDKRGAVLSVDGRDVVICSIHAGVEPAGLSRVANGAEGAAVFKALERTLLLPHKEGGGGDESDDDNDEGAPGEERSDGGSAAARRRPQTRVIAGIDKLERLRGLPLKLLAYEKFLDRRAEAAALAPDEAADRVVLVQYALSSSERSADCEAMRRDCACLCDRIRSKHGADCIVWREVTDLRIKERLALLRIADVFWVSSLRDGLNRWPLEYVAMQTDVLLGAECYAGDVLPSPGLEGGRSASSSPYTSSPSSPHPRSLDSGGGGGSLKGGAATEARREYFDDVLQRMINACGGPAYPCEDPCAFFTQVQNLAAPGEAPPTLADELFPQDLGALETTDDEEGALVLDDNDDAEGGGARSPRQKQQGSSRAASYNANEMSTYDMETDDQGRQFFVVELHKTLSRREKRRVVRYLDCVPDARRQHATRHERCRARRIGALLLSENASATRVLLGAVSTNPWRINDSAAALQQILDMNDRERAARHARDAEFLNRSTTARWAYRVLSDLKALPKDANRQNATHAGLGLNFRVLGMRSGFDALQIDRVARAYRQQAQQQPQPQQPQQQQQQPQAAGATTRVFFLDYGGTLVPDAAQSQIDPVSAFAIAQGERSCAPRPSGEVIAVLKALTADPRNLVFVVSGRERADLVDGFGELDSIPDLGLVAEHGYFLRWPRTLKKKLGAHHGFPSTTPAAHGAKGGTAASLKSAAASAAASGATTFAGPPPLLMMTKMAHARSVAAPGGGPAGDAEWDRLESATLAQWRPIALATMDMFAQRTQGTYVEKHESSLVWQFRDADPDYGEMQAKELETQLAEALAPWASSVDILTGENPSKGGYLEVRPAGVDKGELVSLVLRSLGRAGRRVDFALVVGDDASDEAMFQALATYQQDKPAATQANYFAVTIGKKPSVANSYVDTHDNLIELLQALARVSNRGSRFHSSVDLFQNAPPHLAPVIPATTPAAFNVLNTNVENNSNTNKGSPAASPDAFADLRGSPHGAAAAAAFLDTPASPGAGTDLAASNMGRSMSMPLLAQKPRLKVPSWVSFAQAIEEVEENPEDVEEEQDNAAMFF